MIRHILPTPKKTELFDGITYVKAAISTDHVPFASRLEVFADAADKMLGVSVSQEPGGIRVCYDAALPADAYTFDSREGIVLRASAPEGLMYALATALLGLEPRDGGFICEKAYIEDCPDKDFRGIMVDLARNWHPARQVFCYIDLCFALKLHYLHLHFIDDQLYTLPSKAYPKLPGKKHYSFEDIAAFCEYAKRRGVILIPEFEAPGHSRRLTARYPEVFAISPISQENGAPDAGSIVCGGRQETMDAIRTLLGEICEMFPDAPYIHIGGDEANIKAWNNCADCKAYMEQQGIKDEKELYSDFVSRVTRMVLDLGRTPIVWEGFPKEGADRIPRETIVVAWESYYHMVYDLLAAGFKVINAAWQPLYVVPRRELNWGPKELLNWNVYNWQHWWPNSSAYLNPIHVAPTEQVLGAQLCVWECTYEREIHTAVNNATALSERLWTVKRLWDEKTYFERHDEVIRRLFSLIAEQ